MTSLLARFSIIASALIALSACSSIASGPVFTEKELVPTGQSVVYIFRPAQYHSSAVKFPFQIDEEQVGTIGNSSYLVVAVEPGEHEFRTAHSMYNDKPLTLTTEADKSYFLRVNIRQNDPLNISVTLYLDEVEEELAELELRECRKEADSIGEVVAFIPAGAH